MKAFARPGVGIRGRVGSVARPDIGAAVVPLLFVVKGDTASDQSADGGADRKGGR